MKTLLLDTAEWDLVIDAAGNIALASEPYALAQDAASAIKLFSGELWYDTTKGIPYWATILGKSPPPISLMKQEFEKAALSVPGQVRAKCFISEVANRVVRGQVQCLDQNSRVIAAAAF